MTLSLSVFKTCIVKTLCLRGTSSRSRRHCPGLQNSIYGAGLSCTCLLPTPCGHLPLIDFGLFPNSSVGQRREQTSFSCIIDQPCVSPLSIKQSFILPTNDYKYVLNSWGWPHDIETWEWVIYHFNHLHSLLRNSCFPRGKTSGQCTKEPPSHKFWIGNLWLGSRQPVQLLI